MFKLCDIISGFLNTAVNIVELIAPAIEDMKSGEMLEFNQKTLVNPGVKYFVWSGDCTHSTVNPLFS